MTNRIALSASGLLLTTLALSTTPASAQAPERWASLLAGGFTYDYGGDQTSPAVALRLDHRLSVHLLAEVGASWALANVDIVDNTVPDPTVSEGRSSLGSATVGLQAELPLARARPYVGIAAGVFTRIDHPSGGDRFLRTTMAFPAGVRVPLGERMVARGEARLRFDEHQGGGSSMNTDLLIGLGWRF